MAGKSAPLSQTQLGIYFDCLNMQDASAYNVHRILTLGSSIDLNRFAAAIEKAVAAHPSMFVRVVEQNGEPLQQYDAESYHQTVEQMTEDAWQKKLPELVAEPLELHGGRLFRFYLVQTEKAKYFLAVTHHVLFDGVSRRSLYDDIAKAYADLDAKLAPESYDALDVANDETKARSSEKFSQAKAWYEKTFGGIDIEALPIPDRDDEKISFDKFEKVFPLDYSTLRNFCKTNKISASALTSTAFALLLGTYTHQQESLFSTIYHGRNERTKILSACSLKLCRFIVVGRAIKKLSNFSLK